MNNQLTEWDAGLNQELPCTEPGQLQISIQPKQNH